MSENVKLRFDQQPGQGQQANAGQLENSSTPTDDTGQAAEAESQMRKALGLLGESSRHRPDAERADQSGRISDRFSGGLHRRRFVQDGDIPVTVLRREPGHEAPANRSTAALAAPTNSRLQRTEAALAAETSARERAERLLSESQASARDLQTKIGHAELAKNEAIETLRREREAFTGLRAELQALDVRAQEAEARADEADQAANEHQAALADERHARKALEKTLRATEAARDAARQLAQNLSEAATATPRNDPPSRRRSVSEPEVKRGRKPSATASVVVATTSEPEPVKWWLNTKTTPKRR